MGGEKLNRGFTVEGLIVTYMPRDAGDWNADTIQQRARFFGYKAKYLPLCRLYLHSDVIRAYRGYVRHEEDVRKQLSEHRGRPLREWRRAFFLDARLKPTRKNVLSDTYYRVEKDEPWFVQRYPHVNLEAVRRNADSTKLVESRYPLLASEDYHGHKIAVVPLAEIYRDLLVGYEALDGDRPSWFGQLVTIGHILDDDSNAQVLLMRMRGPRERSSAVPGGPIPLHQGRSSKAAAGSYPGDANIADPNLVTIQIHWLTIKDGGPSNVVALAIRIPPALRKDDIIVSGSV